MKNADMPAIPSGIEQDGYHPGISPLVWGLTKREMFAMHAMQGYLSAHSDSEVCMPDAKSAATDCVAYADALLEELDK